MTELEKAAESLKELNDLEFEIIFIDNVYKKLKALDRAGIRTDTLLFMYFSVVESLKKFKDLAISVKRGVLHEDAVNLIISKCDNFLSSVANDDNLTKYVCKSLSETNELCKELLLVLKRELVSTPKYAHLNPNSEQTEK